MEIEEIKGKILEELSKIEGKFFRGAWFNDNGIDEELGKEALYQLRQEGFIVFDDYLGGPAYGSVRISN